MRIAGLRLLVLALPLVIAACTGPQKSPSPAPSGLFSPGAPPTAEQLCQLLTPADWTAAGLSGARAPAIDDDGPGTGSAYCEYGGGSGASSSLEMDVFVSPTTDDARLVYAQIAQSLPASDRPNVSGVDEALINDNIEPGFGAILARAGKLVVTITLPSSGSAGDQLTSLTTLVLSRAMSLE